MQKLSEAYLNQIPLRCFARDFLKKELQKEEVRLLYGIYSKILEFGVDLLKVFANRPLLGICLDCRPNQCAVALQANCQS